MSEPLVIKSLSKFDIFVSSHIHRLDNKITSFILYPFAAFFHPGLIWIAYSSIFLLSKYDVRFTFQYVLATLLSLLTTYILKKLVQRPRPQLILNTQKSHSFRKKQKNNAMPSGDSFQSAVYVGFLYIMGINPIFLIIFHINVCLGRVYFMCHWLGDTIIASILGIFMAILVLSMDKNQLFYFLPHYLI